MHSKKYLVSGATGFLGKFIIDELDSEAYDSIGRAKSNTIKFDFAQSEIPLTISGKYDFLIIASGHAHVLTSNDTEKLLHFNVNFVGTQKLVDSVDVKTLKGVVYVSSVAVYGEHMKIPFREEDDLLGESPYAKSKIAAEEYLMRWSQQNNVPVLILRVPLIVGKCPPGNLGAMIEAIRKKSYFSVARGQARRSMVLAEDLAKYIVSNCGKHGVYNLSDGFHPSFRELETLISRQLNVSQPKEMPLFVAKIAAKAGDVFSFLPINSLRLKKLMCDLIIDDSKAKRETDWQPRAVIKNLEIK
jgi:nucleoside-diphosphate-sugar epimerase